MEKKVYAWEIMVSWYYDTIYVHVYVHNLYKSHTIAKQSQLITSERKRSIE